MIHINIVVTASLAVEPIARRYTDRAYPAPVSY
jgi:hypothetical protein